MGGLGLRGYGFGPFDWLGFGVAVAGFFGFGAAAAVGRAGGCGVGVWIRVRIRVGVCGSSSWVRVGVCGTGTGVRIGIRVRIRVGIGIGVSGSSSWVRVGVCGTGTGVRIRIGIRVRVIGSGVAECDLVDHEWIAFDVAVGFYDEIAVGGPELVVDYGFGGAGDKIFAGYFGIVVGPNDQGIYDNMRGSVEAAALGKVNYQDLLFGVAVAVNVMCIYVGVEY